MTQQEVNVTDSLGKMSNSKLPESALIWDFTWYLIYGVVMFVVLLFGFVGNVLTLVILRNPLYSGKTMKPHMMNLAMASLVITVMGYPPSMAVILSGKSIRDRPATCKWYAFVLGATGMTCIGILTEMSLVLAYSLRKLNTKAKLSRKQHCWLIVGSWIYGIGTMLPPLLGWNRFVPGAAGINCAPDWADQSLSGMSYNVILLVIGFFLPLAMITASFVKTYRNLRHNFVPCTQPLQLRRKMYIRKILRMTVVVVIVFMLSWTPYTYVSLAAIFNGHHVFTGGEAEIPELMAKTSVVYHPIIYTVMNNTFRSSLCKVIRCKRNSPIVDVNAEQPGNLQGGMAFILRPIRGINAFTGLFVVA